MSFAALVRNGVALADNLTGSLQGTVQYEAWTGADPFGDYSYAAAVPVQAIIERKQELVTDYEGAEVVSSHVITILRPIAANGAAGRNEPIDPRDRFTIADGSTTRTIAVETLVSPETGAGYYQIVKLGKQR